MPFVGFAAELSSLWPLSAALRVKAPLSDRSVDGTDTLLALLFGPGQGRRYVERWCRIHHSMRCVKAPLSNNSVFGIGTLLLVQLCQGCCQVGRSCRIPSCRSLGWPGAPDWSRSFRYFFR